MATAYTLTFNGPTKIWSRTGTGIISWPSTITHPAGGPYIVVPTSIPFDPIHETGGSFWVLKGGPHVGFLVSFWSNSLGYGDITIGNDATEPRVSGTPHVNALADWRVLIKDLGGGTAGGHLLTFNDTTNLWSRTTGGIISWPSTLDAAPGGPYRVNPIVVPFDPIHETGGSFWELKEGPNRGFLVSFHSNSLGYGDITVTDGPLNRGPGPVLATFYHPNPHLAGASMNYNAAGEFHMTLLVDDPNILVPKPKETHYAVEFRDADSDEWVEVFAGMIWDIDGTETEVVFYGIDYLALYQYVVDDRFDPGFPNRPAPNGSFYVQKTITEIVTAQLQYSKDLANSPVGFINIGEITATMGYVLTGMWSTFHNTMEFVVGLLNSHRAGTGKFTRLSVEKRDDGEYEVIIVDDPGVTRDELRLQYGDLVQGYRAIPFGLDWASRVNFVGRSRDGLKVMFQTVNSPADELRWGRISQAPVYEESFDPADLRRRALQASIDASRLGRQIGVGTKLGSYRPFEGYRLCDMVVVDINHGAVQTQDWGNDSFGSDPSGDPSEVTAALWAIVGVQWESFDDGHWITTPLLFPKGLGKVKAADCSTVLGEIVVASAISANASTLGTPISLSVDITPADTDPVVLLSYMTSIGGDTPEGHGLLVPASYTAMDDGFWAGTTGGLDDPAWAQRTALPTRATYRALADPAVTPYTAASQYLQGNGGSGWLALQIAIHTAAMAPVQAKRSMNSSSLLLGRLDSTPAPGNILIAFVAGPGASSISPEQTGWTELGNWDIPDDFVGGGQKKAAIFVRCYSDGDGAGIVPDGAAWNFLRGSPTAANYGHISEWAIVASSLDSGASGTLSPVYSLSMHGSVDPTAGAGVAADLHAMYTRDSDGVTWMKIGPLDTDWRQLAFV